MMVYYNIDFHPRQRPTFGIPVKEGLTTVFKPALGSQFDCRG